VRSLPLVLLFPDALPSPIKATVFSFTKNRQNTNKIITYYKPTMDRLVWKDSFSPCLSSTSCSLVFLVRRISSQRHYENRSLLKMSSFLVVVALVLFCSMSYPHSVSGRAPRMMRNQAGQDSKEKAKETYYQAKDLAQDKLEEGRFEIPPLLLGTPPTKNLPCFFILLIAAKEDLQRNLRYGSEKMESLKQAAKDKYYDIKDSVKDKYDDIKDYGAEKIEDLKDSAEDKYNEFKYSRPGEKLKENYEELKDSAKNKYYDIKDSAEDVKEEAEDKYYDTKDELKRDMRYGSRKMEDAAEYAKEKLRDWKDYGAEKIEDLKDSAKGKYYNIKDEVKRDARAVEDKMEDLKEGAKENWRHMKEEVKEGVRDSNPGAWRQTDELESQRIKRRKLAEEERSFEMI
jgi:gas vesicle protein